MTVEGARPQALGAWRPRADGEEKVTGTARYTADVALPGTLWGKTLRSPFPYARIARVDTSRATSVPGVRAVLTGEDLPGDARYGRRIVDVPVLARDVVRFVGEQVAAVAAEDEETAQRALDLVEIEYEELDPLLDPEEALRPGAPILHPGVASYEGLVHPLDGPTNAFVQYEWGRGERENVEARLAEAEVVVENTFTTGSHHQSYLEPHCCLVRASQDGSADVWAPNKAPYAARRQVSRAIGVPVERIRFRPVTIGGDFGGKGSPMNIPLCYFLSRASGRPVRMVFDYQEEFMAGNPRHSSRIRMRTGARRDGSLVAHQAEVVFNSGAYAGFKPVGHLPGAAAAGGPYRVEHSRVREVVVYTNNVPCGHCRAPGEPQAMFALESQMDCVARAVGMDAGEFRRRNLIRDAEEDAAGRRFQDVRAVETLDAALEASCYRTERPAGVGRGIAVGDRAPGGGETHAAVTLGPDGSVVVHTPVFEQGTGSYTVIQMVVAEVLGLPAERVTVRIWDTDAVAFDSGVGGSRVTRIGSQVVHAAATEAADALRRAGARIQGWPEERLEVRGDVLVRGDTGESRPWAEVVQRNGEVVVGRGHVRDTDPSPVTAFTVQVAEVAVDSETGQVTLRRLTSAHDAGRILNPLGYQGQINGGVAMGIGFGLMEELQVEDGRVSTLSFGDYKVPNVADMPELKTVSLESDSGVGPYKVKGIGENPNTPTAGAIANAVADAAGVRIRDLPVTAEKVHAALARHATGSA